jgi:hypothetical protein
MTRPAINPGKVDWSGENPGMYLKETADGPFVTLISFFRVVLSPHGKHAAFMLLDLRASSRDPVRPNVCLTDNEPLAAYLREVRRSFQCIQGATGCRAPHHPGWDFMAAGDGGTTHTEWFRSTLGQVGLT